MPKVDRYGYRGYSGRERGYGEGDRDERGREFAGDSRDFGRSEVPGERCRGRDEVNDVAFGRGFDDPVPGQSFGGRGPKNYRRPDERLRELVSERLEDHEAIDASDMDVTVEDGVMTLTGTVDSRRTNAWPKTSPSSRPASSMSTTT